LNRFPKSKDEGWFLVLGNIEDNQDLLALKRVPVLRPGKKNSQQVRGLFGYLKIF